MQIDFGKTAEDYGAYRIGFANELINRLEAFGVGLPRQPILDVGAGTGLFGQSLLRCGSHVTLMDVSTDLLRKMNSGFRVAGRVEAIPFAAESFEAVTAAQCWHWFDRVAAPKEILRVLRPSGRLAVIYQTYIPLPGTVAEASEKLILRHRPGWRHANSTGINGQALRDMQAAGFVKIESFSFDLEIAFSRDHWRGYIRATSPVGASMSAGQVERFDQEHQSLLEEWPPGLAVPHRVFAAIAQKPGSAL